MEEKYQDTISGEFKVEIVEKSIVKPNKPLPKSHILPLSNLDLLSGRFPISYFYVYSKPKIDDHTFSFVVKALKISLASTLSIYYPFAGTIIYNPKTREPEILCNNKGALFFEAHANIPLAKLDFYDLKQSLQGKLIHEGDHEHPLCVQVTGYICGSVTVAFTFDHALGDASTFANFLRSWSETAQSKSISCVPFLERTLNPRSPPTYHPNLDQIFISCELEEIINMPRNDIELKLLYHIDATHIENLQRLCSIGGVKRTKVEALSAYVWKLMATTIKAPTTTHCKMGWLVDGRRRMPSKMSSMRDYIGNVLSVAIGEASIENLQQESLSKIAELVHVTIAQVTNEAHFLDLIDWVECHRPATLLLPKILLGRSGPALVFSSAAQFPVRELDFGFGPPMLGCTFSDVNQIGAAYMNQRPSARGDGSWVVSTILWPELARALELDPNHVFQPMSLSYLGL